jgi:hypothetical protein
MQFLLAALSQDEMRLNAARGEYVDVLKEWNDKQSILVIRLKRFGQYRAARAFENDVHERLVDAGRHIEARLSGNYIRDKQEIAQDLSNVTYWVSRLQGMLHVELEERRLRLHGRYVPEFIPENFNQISTFQLFKMLFKPLHD